jgi:hypothetical protein
MFIGNVFEVAEVFNFPLDPNETSRLDKSRCVFKGKIIIKEVSRGWN